jgi:flavin reductase (DIM6/NTAB) family NADH-FMN oxidoreductase RutF
MDANAMKAALRMIAYGIYILTAKGGDGTVAAATVNWVTQTSFDPPLVAVGVKADSSAYATVKGAGNFTRGDHHIVVGEAINVHLPKPLEGRPDAAVMKMKDLGETVFYGG